MRTGDFPFWIFLGDIHGEIQNIHLLSELKYAQGVVLTGDIGKNGTKNDTIKIIQTLKQYNEIIFAQIGNMDDNRTDEYLTENHINLHKNSIQFADMRFFGIGGSLPTPFATKSEFSEAYYEEILKNFTVLPENVQDNILTLLISHNPPFDTACDKIKNGRHVGSKTIRNFIRDYQPDFCICGHIHESRALDTIGKTVVCNPGDFASGYYGKLILSQEPEIKLCSIHHKEF